MGLPPALGYTVLSVLFGFILMLLPMIFGWQVFFRRHRGKPGVIVYFLCLGLGYIFVEIAMISKYILCLGNATVSVTILVTGMLLVFRPGQLPVSPVCTHGRAGSRGRLFVRSRLLLAALFGLP